MRRHHFRETNPRVLGIRKSKGCGNGQDWKIGASTNVIVQLLDMEFLGNEIGYSKIL